MAKVPETRDRMRIFCEVEQEMVGSIIIMLTNLGVAQIGHEVITDVATWRQKAPRKEEPPKEAPSVSPQGTAVDFVREYANKHHVFNIADLKVHLRAAGRSAGAASTAVKTMIISGELRQLARGHYQSSGVKALPAPGKTAKKAKPQFAAKKFKAKQPVAAKKTSARGPHKLYEISNNDVVIKYMKGRSQISAAALNQWFEQDGRPAKSSGSLLSQFAAKGYLKNRGGGLWDITAKGVKLATPKLNGAESPAAVQHTEQTNG